MLWVVCLVEVVKPILRISWWFVVIKIAIAASIITTTLTIIITLAIITETKTIIAINEVPKNKLDLTNKQWIIVNQRRKL